MSNAETLKKLRAEAAAKGMCGECRARPREPMLTRCRVCLNRVRDWHARGRVGIGKVSAKQPDRFCVSCQAHSFHRHGCAAVRP